MAITLRSVWHNLANTFAFISSRFNSAKGNATSIADDESVGRGVFDTKKARQARSGKIAPRVFRERDGVLQISVDRLSLADRTRLAALHDIQRAPQILQGWAQISVENAVQMERHVIASPLPTNPWHAEIVLPTTDPNEAAEHQDQHALNLAMLAVWAERP
jgi:hypothetical protein